MNGIVDWLPYIDKPVAELRGQIELLVEQELQNCDLNVVHPEVENLLGGEVPSRIASLFPRGVKRSQPNTEDVAMIKKKCSGIDKSRYELSNCKSHARRAILHSYMGHQEAVLTNLLPRTLAQQWATNNEYMKGVCDSVNNVLELQEGQIRDLEEHRKHIQIEAKRELAYLEDQWRDKLLQNVEGAIENGT
ncbi:LANO_0G10132g1_1 [Lachancea nothofagi CBS 11611]|uniref:LANO_0G10132g1_1 n=1 Tax=Lachancea nothofagi CBS 11611 TaxID=1266666 RepID=A0A1G4KJ34_9SACH|nr:LANO_0G10132g1_1 [Lachancea nothofagi CBS 11611]